MSRVFLSHSSFDKDFVEKVFEELGTARAVYDKDTFQRNSDLAIQIREGLENCDIYALFLSSTSLKSNWVTSELDVASELKTQWKISKFFVFQLDETQWSELPQWMRRYVASCPPSPSHVALRLLDEINNITEKDLQCHGRSENEKEIIDSILESERTPAYIYLSGPIGIGRKTLASAVYKTIYPDINDHKIQISIDPFDGICDFYRKTLGYSANWRAYDLKVAMDDFLKLSEQERNEKLARQLVEISVKFRQVVIIDLGTAALTEEGRPQVWFYKLTQSLPLKDYPYIWFLSQRFLSGVDISNGIFYSVEPLNDEWSRFLFRVLIKHHKIVFPSKDEQQHIENCITGHPGLITMVANYLRRNPRYKPNRTHNNIVKLINEQVQGILNDFIGGDIEKERTVAFYAETYILSYEEINMISSEWPAFEQSTEALLDAGLLLRSGGDYFLASYLQRYANTLSERHHDSLNNARKILLSAFDMVTEESFMSTQLLDARICEHILDGRPISSYLSNLVMPCQQIKAAKRKYDAQEYSTSLSLAKSAFLQTEKLSHNGQREAWRLIGLSAIRIQDEESFQLFLSEYKKVPKGLNTDAIYYFVNGLKERTSGNLRQALIWYKKIEEKYYDSHVYRELAYIYAFERNFAEAYTCVNKAHELAYGNPYILDILAVILLEWYKSERSGVKKSEIERCLDELNRADKHEGTSFYLARSKMADVIINNDLNSLSELFSSRKSLPILAKVALLSMLSLKGKDLQYNELHTELRKILRDKKNPLAQIEIARIDIEHLSYRDQYKEAAELLFSNREKLTDKCYENLARNIPEKFITT